jgi:tyrosyl-tRNA synthetase
MIEKKEKVVKQEKAEKELSVEERLALIKRNTAEIIREEELVELLKKKKHPVVYWGTSPTGKPHVGYLFPALIMSDFIKAGFKLKILLADLHAALDNVPWPILEKRYDYYSEVIPLLLQAMGVDIKNVEFVKGSDFQLKPEYMFDVLRMSSFVSVHDANKAASDVVKMGDNPKLSGLIYPIMQAMDEIYLEADCQLGGTDQRKIMVLARENHPKIDYEPRVEIMNPLIPGLTAGGKMSASVEESKIDLLEDEKTVESKINKAYCLEGDLNNGLLPFLKYVIFVMKQDKGDSLLIERPEKFGGNKKYSTYAELEKDFVEKKLHPMDLKKSIAIEINKILAPIRKNKERLDRIAKEAYGK